MKKVFLLALIFLMVTCAWAQAPQKMSYQAIIRNASNIVVASSTVGIKISIVKGTPNGPAVFAESHTKSTNANGLLSLEIGAGTGESTAGSIVVVWTDGLDSYVTLATAGAGKSGTDAIITGTLNTVATLTGVTPGALVAANFDFT